MLIWRLHPNGGRVAVVAIPDDEKWPLIRERGWITIDGHQATVQETMPDAEGMVSFRIAFDEPYPHPHP